MEEKLWTKGLKNKCKAIVERKINLRTPLMNNNNKTFNFLHPKCSKFSNQPTNNQPDDHIRFFNNPARKKQTNPETNTKTTGQVSIKWNN